MRCEIPTPKKCCFCFPLRIGLLVAGYIKIILSALYLLYTSCNLYVFLAYVDWSEHYVILMIVVFSLFNCIVDVVFHLIFLIGAHKKDYKKIRMYYRYCIYNIIAIIVFFFINVGLFMNMFVFFFLLKYVIFVAILFIWTLVIQIYLLILVRSEFLKLKGNTQFQFVNNDAEAQCSATIKISGDGDEVENDNDKDNENDNDNEMDYDKISV